MQRYRTGLPLVVDPNENLSGFVSLAELIMHGLDNHVPLAIGILPAGLQTVEDEEAFVYAPFRIWEYGVYEPAGPTGVPCPLTAFGKIIHAGMLVETVDAEIGTVLANLNNEILNFCYDTGRDYLLAVAIKLTDSQLSAFWLNGALVKEDANFDLLLNRQQEALRC